MNSSHSATPTVTATTMLEASRLKAVCGEVHQLVEDAALQGLEHGAQAGLGIHHRLNGLAFGVKGVVGAAQMMLDQRIQAAAVETVGNFPKGLQIDGNLIEPASDSLSVLHCESRQATAGYGACYKHYPVEQAAE